MKQKPQQENTKLQEKLARMQAWMKREVDAQIVSIGKKRILKDSFTQNAFLIGDEMEEIITEKILLFFSDVSLIDISADFITHLSQSEIQYYFLIHGHKIAPLSITIWYQKVLEELIENIIISDFRRFAKKQDSIKWTLLDGLETSLSLVIEKWYSLSIWRLYHLLSLIKKDMVILPHQKLFLQYLEKSPFLKKTLLKKKFLLQLETVVESEIFSGKRHSGNVTKKEVILIRKVCLWNLSDRDCLMYKLFKTQEIL